MKSHDDYRLEIPAYSANRLDAELRERLEIHFAVCPECAALAETCEGIVERLRTGGEVIVGSHLGADQFSRLAEGHDPVSEQAAHLESCVTCALEAEIWKQSPPKRHGERTRWLPLAASFLLGALVVGTYGLIDRDAPEPTEAVNWLLLQAPSRGSTRVPVVTVAREQPYLPLAIPLSLPNGIGDPSEIRFVIESAENRTVFDQSLSVGQVRDQLRTIGVIWLMVPLGEMAPGTFTIRVESKPDGQRIAEAAFEIAN